MRKTKPGSAIKNNKEKALLRIYNQEWCRKTMAGVFPAAFQGSLDVKSLIETSNLKVYGVTMENDSTALKPAIQYDESHK